MPAKAISRIYAKTTAAPARADCRRIPMRIYEVLGTDHRHGRCLLLTKADVLGASASSYANRYGLDGGRVARMPPLDLPIGGTDIDE
jgi:hypothetical protein